MSFIELHVLQNFSPSNLNRDDTGSPKDCEFGGHRRARISSQCQKRATRKHFETSSLVTPEELAVRTKRASDHVAGLLQRDGRTAEECATAAKAAVEALGIKADKKRPGLTRYLVYLSKDELANLASWANDNWDSLLSQGESKDKKKQKVDAPATLKSKLEGKRAADLALFGRMLADLPEDAVDAAAQVAHALSTNRVSVEFDYYTAVDDLQPDDNAGADMVGTIEFNSACYYRYANVNLDLLRKNLDGDDDLTNRTLEAFLRGFALSIPTGKQNSMAAHNPPSFILGVRRDSAPCNLANAFLKPARAKPENDLVRASVAALDEYWGKLNRKFGTHGITDVVAWTLDDQELESIASIVENFEELVARLCGRATQEKAA